MFDFTRACVTCVHVYDFTVHMCLANAKIKYSYFYFFGLSIVENNFQDNVSTNEKSMLHTRKSCTSRC